MEVVSQIGLKAKNKCIKTTVIGIISLKTTIYGFSDDSGDRSWQPLLVSSQPFLDFLEPCVCLPELVEDDHNVGKEGDNTHEVSWGILV